MRSTPLGRTSLVSLALVALLLTLSMGLSLHTSPALASTAEADSIPESGAQLTAAVWRMAIGQAVVDAGETKLGAPYVYSAGGPNAFDCSGFTRWAWRQLGVELPHNSGAQWAMVEPIPLDELQPGDLVFNWGPGDGQPGHVGLYVGDGIMIHSPNSSGVVRYDSINWWTGATTRAGRVQ